MGCKCNKELTEQEISKEENIKKEPPEEKGSQHVNYGIENNREKNMGTLDSYKNLGEKDKDKLNIIEPTAQVSDPPVAAGEYGTNNLTSEKLRSGTNKSENNKKSKPDYKVEALKLINKIRADPKSFIDDVEKAKKLIQEKDGKLIFGGKVKVALKEGETAFDQAIEALKKLDKLEPLELSDEITIPVPEDEEKMKTSKTLTELVEQKKANGTLIDVFFKDSVKDFYTSVLLLIIDDSGKSKGKKRNAVLSNTYTKIGLSFKKINKTFAAYYTFSK